MRTPSDRGKLTLLNDLPAGADDTSKIAFNHKVYGELLRDVLLHNRPGLCVGFFARWGQGKSTVVNLLKRALGESAHLVLFNAYHTRGDSVRRQMLLSVLRQIDSKKAEQFERFNQTVTPLEFATAEEQKRCSDQNIVRLLLFEHKVDFFLVVSACVAILCAAAFVCKLFTALTSETTFSESKDILGWLGGVILGCVAYVGRKLQERRTALLAYTQPVSDSQRLKYPEQFARVFENAVKENCHKSGRRLVIVVDDLDRCDPGTVVEALASVRQFCHRTHAPELNCQFLIPCDEAQMVAALEADGYTLTPNHAQYHNYSETEMLRKFFDVVVRMDDIVPESLADYAAELATEIGTDATLAREMVDAAGLREPRKVKSLINAYKVAKSIVTQNQAAGLLPASDKVKNLDRTLAIVVCLQELAPNAYSAIREHPEVSYLDHTQLGKEVEPIARRILAGLGPLACATAELLFTKQYESSLAGLKQGYGLSAAVARDDDQAIVNILTQASCAERNNMFGWFGQKIRDARSGAYIRRLLGYLLYFGQINGWNDQALGGAVMCVLRRQQFIRDALRLGLEMEYWIGFCATLPNEQRYHFDEVIIANFFSAGSDNFWEERYLFKFANQLQPKHADRFRVAVALTLCKEDGTQVSGFKRVGPILRKDTAAGFGFAPDIGEKILDVLLRNPSWGDATEDMLVVGLRLLGDNPENAARLVSQLAANKVMQNQQGFSEDSQPHKVMFSLLHGLLVQSRDLASFGDFFTNCYVNWFAKRHTAGRAMILSAIQPGFGFLNDGHLNSIAKAAGFWVWQDERVAEQVVQIITSAERSDRNWVDKRDLLIIRILEQFSIQSQESSELTPAGSKFLKALVQTGLNLRDAAEASLANKVRRLNPNVGAPPNIDVWFAALRPLCASELVQVSKAVQESLANNPQPLLLVRFAQKTVWKDAIPEECAIPLAKALTQASATLLNNDAEISNLVCRKGFDEVARILLKQIPQLGVDGMVSNSQLMKALGKFTANHADLSNRFQDAVDILLTANRADIVSYALSLLEGHEHINDDVRKSLNSLLKARPDNDPIKKVAAELCSKPSFRRAP